MNSKSAKIYVRHFPSWNYGMFSKCKCFSGQMLACFAFKGNIYCTCEHTHTLPVDGILGFIGSFARHVKVSLSA